MNKIISTLLIVTTFIFVGCEKSPSNSLNTTNNMEGKWIHENNSLNTMYIFQDGVRYTYYCSGRNCDSLYQTYQAGDGNNLPETNNYTYQNDTLTINLNFGNVLVTPIVFENNGNKATFTTPGYSLFKLN
jgi:hypothetical protein